jgi:hypothetical protein
MAKSKVIEAVGTSASVGLPRQPGLGKRVEDAMTKAVLDALAEGISMDDVETIKARKMAARAVVLENL